MTTNRRLLAVTIVVGLGLSAIGDASAQSYPSRMVTLVNPFPAGGGIDVICRLVADKLRTFLGQQFIVENRTGGGGNVGAEFVSRATPDGHTLLCAPDPVFISHLLYPNLSFDPRAFEPVSMVATLPNVLIGRADLPVSNVVELIAYARAHPGKLNYASQGIGQTSHLALEALKMMAAIDMVHVPYRGGAPALNDLLAGQVDIYVGPLAGSFSNIKAGKLKLLAAAGRTRLAAFPDVPALTEAVPGLEAETLLAIAAPPGTPRDIIRKLSNAIARALQMPELRARILEVQAEPLGTTPDQMKELIRQATERWGPVIAAGKISID